LSTGGTDASLRADQALDALATGVTLDTLRSLDSRNALWPFGSRRSGITLDALDALSTSGTSVTLGTRSSGVTLGSLRALLTDAGGTGVTLRPLWTLESGGTLRPGVTLELRALTLGGEGHTRPDVELAVGLHEVRLASVGWRVGEVGRQVGIELDTVGDLDTGTGFTTFTRGTGGASGTLRTDRTLSSFGAGLTGDALITGVALVPLGSGSSGCTGVTLGALRSGVTLGTGGTLRSFGTTVTLDAVDTLITGRTGGTFEPLRTLGADFTLLSGGALLTLETGQTSSAGVSFVALGALRSGGAGDGGVETSIAGLSLVTGGTLDATISPFTPLTLGALGADVSLAVREVTLSSRLDDRRLRRRDCTGLVPCHVDLPSMLNCSPVLSGKWAGHSN